jgi:hypothetical protein
MRQLMCILIFFLLATSSLLAGSFGTLTFTNPTGSVSQTDSIPVWLRLTLGPSYALATDETRNVTTGLTMTDILANLFGNVPDTFSQDDTLHSRLSVFFGCSGTFTSSCIEGPPYDFDWNFTPPSFISPGNLSLAAGSSTDYLFGTFVPTGGTAPPGTYQFSYTGITIDVYDDTLGGIQIAAIPVADTGTEGPGFTREVVSGQAATVPEPGTVTLFGAGLALLAGAARQSRRRTR